MWGTLQLQAPFPDPQTSFSILFHFLSQSMLVLLEISLKKSEMLQAFSVSLYSLWACSTIFKNKQTKNQHWKLSVNRLSWRKMSFIRLLTCWRILNDSSQTLRYPLLDAEIWRASFGELTLGTFLSFFVGNIVDNLLLLTFRLCSGVIVFRSP